MPDEDHLFVKEQLRFNNVAFKATNWFTKSPAVRARHLITQGFNVDPVGGVLLLNSNDANVFSAEQQIHDLKLALAARAATFN